MTAARFLCVGTHHKTGTVWMRRTFHKFASSEGIPIIRVGGKFSQDELPETGPALLVNWSSTFPRDLLDRDDVRAFHMIRDPRDVLISGARYHLTAKTGNEKWLARPRREFGGLSYQEKINTEETRTAQLRFEMHNKHKSSMEEMLGWPYGHRNVVDVKYEDLINDTDASLFRQSIETMDVQGFDKERLLEFYWTHSIFGGLKEADNMKGNVKSHIKSGRTAQWRDGLPPEIAREYCDTFGKDLITLGYEEDTSWVSACDGNTTD